MARFWKIGLGLAVTTAVLAGLVLLGLHLNNQLNKKQSEVAAVKAAQDAQQNSVLSKAQAALKADVESAGGLSSSYDPSTKTLTIIEEEDPGSGLDQGQQAFTLTPELLVRRAFSIFVYVGMAVFKVERVEKLTLVQKVPLDTGSGTVALTDVVRLSSTKAKFNSVDWKSLIYKPIYPQIKEIAEPLYIEPRVARSIKNAGVLVLVPS